MLSITVGKTALYFNNLKDNDELYEAVKEMFPQLELTPKGNYRITGTPKDLYFVLYELTNVYDVEM